MNTIKLKEMYNIVLYANKSLELNMDYINSLNVFPVPDGDTGTNMFMTFSAGTKDVIHQNPSSISQLFAVLAKGTLMGARGNSGVILSRIIKGFSLGFENSSEEVSVKDFVSALTNAKTTAYSTVLNPKEGTILSVVRAASEAAEFYKDSLDIYDFLSEVYSATNRMLLKTETMLEENKAAGTVDAGAAGFAMILKSFLDVLDGKTLDEADLLSLTKNAQTKTNSLTQNAISGSIENKYCTEFFIKKELNSVDEAEFRTFLSEIGDSLVVISEQEITKVHVHTKNPGVALAKAVSYGDLTGIKIDNMEEQHNENPYIVEQKPLLDMAIISVCNGDGIEKVFKSFGCNYVVNGGQSMNPSVEELVSAIKNINAKKVILLPNNKNIILSAEQCRDILKDSIEVFVVPTRTIPQGLSAMLEYNPSGDVEDIVDSMNDIISKVKSYSITKADKNIVLNYLTIEKGLILGIENDDIKYVDANIEGVLDKIFNEYLMEDASVVTIFYGEDVSKVEVDNSLKSIISTYKDVEFVVEYGGQKIYPYIIGIE